MIKHKILCVYTLQVVREISHCIKKSNLSQTLTFKCKIGKNLLNTHQSHTKRIAHGLFNVRVCTIHTMFKLQWTESRNNLQFKILTHL